MSGAGHVVIKGKTYPRMQILSVEEILAGKGFDTPTRLGGTRTFKSEWTLSSREDQALDPRIEGIVVGLLEVLAAIAYAAFDAEGTPTRPRSGRQVFGGLMADFEDRIKDSSLKARREHPRTQATLLVYSTFAKGLAELMEIKTE